MISFTLKCANDHRFDSWFQSSAAFDKLCQAGLISCSVCGSDAVTKAPMTPRVRTARAVATPKDVATKSVSLLSAPGSKAEIAMREFKEKVESNSENVGENFAAEARAIHMGDAPERSIRGEAKSEDARALMEDGVPVVPLPWGARNTN